MLKKSFYFLFFGVLIFTGCGGGGSSDSVSSTSGVVPILSVPTNLTITKNVDANFSKILKNRGSAITSCTVSPDLPTGLTLNNDCSISGTVSTDENGVLYTFTATNALGTNSVTTTIEVASAITATISGTITYDSVPVSISGLDYGSTTQKAVRGAVLEIVDVLGNVLNTVQVDTDNTGAYSVTVDGTMVKVRVLAKLYKAPAGGASSWDFQVKDNTNSNALYVMEGSLASLSQNSRNLNAPSGWGGSSYTSTRVAGPFALLDVVYQAVDKITTAQADAVFPPLNVFWSKNNIDADGDKALGQIITSHYDSNTNGFYILGTENQDTDEYDVAVVAHEWSHFYEDKFSRADSTGGFHTDADMLDMRLAFGEGFATAFGCMILDTPFYRDSLGNAQAALSANSNLELGGSTNNPGWFSETSIYNILYDIYDSDDDTGDTLSLGFAPINNVLINAEKDTAAFTSIFTFIKALKDANPGNDTAIDNITQNESIAPITDINGTGRTNRSENASPLYSGLAVGESVDIVTDYSASASSFTRNKLGRYNFVRFTIPSDGNYRIDASSASGTNLKFMAFKAGTSFIEISSTAGNPNAVYGTAALTAGDYRMFVTDTNLKAGTTISVSLANN